MDSITLSTRRSIIDALAKELCSSAGFLSQQDVWLALQQIEAAAYDYNTDVGAYFRACTSGAASIKHRLASRHLVHTDEVQEDAVSCTDSALSRSQASHASFCSREDLNLHMGTSKTEHSARSSSLSDTANAACTSLVVQLSPVYVSAGTEHCCALPCDLLQPFDRPYAEAIDQAVAKSGSQRFIFSTTAQTSCVENSLAGLLHELSDPEPWPFVDELLGASY